MRLFLISWMLSASIAIVPVASTERELQTSRGAVCRCEQKYESLYTYDGRRMMEYTDSENLSEFDQTYIEYDFEESEEHGHRQLQTTSPFDYATARVNSNGYYLIQGTVVLPRKSEPRCGGRSGVVFRAIGGSVRRDPVTGSYRAGPNVTTTTADASNYRGRMRGEDDPATRTEGIELDENLFKRKESSLRRRVLVVEDYDSRQLSSKGKDGYHYEDYYTGKGGYGKGGNGKGGGSYDASSKGDYGKGGYGKGGYGKGGNGKGGGSYDASSKGGYGKGGYGKGGYGKGGYGKGGYSKGGYSKGGYGKGGYGKGGYGKGGYGKGGYGKGGSYENGKGKGKGKGGDTYEGGKGKGKGGDTYEGGKGKGKGKGKGNDKPKPSPTYPLPPVFDCPKAPTPSPTPFDDLPIATTCPDGSVGPIDPDTCVNICTGTVKTNCKKRCPRFGKKPAGCVTFCTAGTLTPTGCVEKCCPKLKTCPDDPSMFAPLNPQKAKVACAPGSNGKFPKGCADFCTGLSSDSKKCIKKCDEGTLLPEGCKEMACAKEPAVCPIDPSMSLPLDPDNCAVQCADQGNTFPEGCVDFCTGSSSDSSDCVGQCEAGTFLPTGCREMCCEADPTMFPTESPVSNIIPVVTDEPTESPVSNIIPVITDEPTLSPTDTALATCPDDPTMTLPIDPANCGVPCIAGSGGTFPTNCVVFCTGASSDSPLCIETCTPGTLEPGGCREMCCKEEPAVCPDDPTMNAPLDPENCSVQCANAANTFPEGCVDFADGVGDGISSVPVCIVGTFLPEGCQEMCCGADPTMPPTTAPPTLEPSAEPTNFPTLFPVLEVVAAPTNGPTLAPIEPPTKAPIDLPTNAPIDPPTNAPITAAPVPLPTCPLDPSMPLPVDPDNCGVVCAKGSNGRFPAGCVDFCTGSIRDRPNCIRTCIPGTSTTPSGCREMCCKEKPEVCPDDPTMVKPLNPANCALQCADAANTFPEGCVDFRDGNNDSLKSVEMCQAGTFLPRRCREKCCGEDPTLTPTAVPVADIIPAPIPAPTTTPEECPFGDGFVPLKPERCLPRCPATGPRPTGCGVFCPTDGSKGPAGCIPPCPRDGSTRPFLCREPCCDVETSPTTVPTVMIVDTPVVAPKAKPKSKPKSKPIAIPGKGKGKGKGGDYEYGKGKGKGGDYEYGKGKGKGGSSYDYGKGKGGSSYDYGKGKGGSSYDYGKGKGGSSSEGKGGHWYDYGNGGYGKGGGKGGGSKGKGGYY